jgi:DnaK suppressor protein
MPTKNAATKKKGTAVSKKTAPKKAAPEGSTRSDKTSTRKGATSVSKKTVKSAKSTSQKQVTQKKVSAPKGAPKSAVKKSAATPSAKATPSSSPPETTEATKSAAATTPRPAGSVLYGPLRGFKPYQPKKGEEYMSKGQLEHFRQILLAWKRELMEEVDRTVLHMKDEAANFPDPNDRATQESEFGLELRTRDRERKLLKKIDAALQRIEDGTYGYCEETGDEIGLRRLEARPVATLCVEAQERRELAERQYRDREDQYR